VEESIRYASPAAIFVPSHGGMTARSISLFRLPVWVVAVSSSEQTCRNLLFSYGVYPVFEEGHPDDWDAYIRDWLGRHRLTGDLAILTEGPSARHPDAHNRMEIIELGKGPERQGR
jgi:pyruvate kinase